MLSRSERGTALLLFPAAFLVMLVLGAIVVDIGLTQVRARELDAVATSAANDALAALDIGVLRDKGDVALDPDRIREIAAEAIANGPLPDARLVDVEVRRDALLRTEIAVTVSLRVELVMAPAIPGAPTATTITRTGVAVVLVG